MHTYLGFNYSGTSTITGNARNAAGSIWSHIGNSSLTDTLIKILIVGGISLPDLFFLHEASISAVWPWTYSIRAGKDRLVMGTVEALSGIENAKLIHFSADRLWVSLG